MTNHRHAPVMLLAVLAAGCGGSGSPGPAPGSPPANLRYSSNPAAYVVGTAITANVPSSSGSAVDSYSVAPAIPPGLSLNTSTGIIGGTPTAATPSADYTVTATNAWGSTTAILTIAVSASLEPPNTLTYSANPAVYTVGLAIPANVPSSGGGAASDYSVTPVLPPGLSLNLFTGVISGTPTAETAPTSYTVTAGNPAGSTTALLDIRVVSATPGPAPTGLRYSSNPAVYAVGVPIASNRPTSSGGSVDLYAVTPPLPSGLGLDPLTGVISGTPSVATPDAVYVVTAANAAGNATLDLHVAVTSVGSLRVANLSPDLVAPGAGLDFCVVPTGAGFVGATAVMGALPSGIGSTGLIFGGTADGSRAVSKYFTYDAGTYDVAVFQVGLIGASCANPLLTVTGVIVGTNGGVTVGAIGQRALTGSLTGGLALGYWTDTMTVSNTKVAARFINTGFLNIGAATVVLPAYDVVQQLAGGFNALFTNINYPNAGTTTGGTGYAVVDPSVLAATLYVCPYTLPATRPPSPLCSVLPLPSGIGNTAGRIATIFNVGTELVPPAVATPPLSIFCGDSEPLFGTAYSACLAQ